MQVYSDSMEENLTIQFAWDDNNLDTYDEFLIEAISLADTINLYYSLDNAYPHIRNLLKSNDFNKDVSYQQLIKLNYTPNHLQMFSDSILYNRKKLDQANIKLELYNCSLTDEHIEMLQPCIAYLENLIISANSEMSSQSMKFISDSDLYQKGST